MSEAERLDPVQIVAVVGGVTEELSDLDRGFELWVHLARREGWEVSSMAPLNEPWEDGVLGSAVVEGITYRIRSGPRVRRSMADDSTGRLTYRPVLVFAAWAEPDLSAYELEPGQ
ncbi:hypothetical protein [Streptomyces sp. NPDC023838]|uniref:hypothetical protein n=1 Tax=Streptomyces sp. NPDC023838 TaxID=3154325 RepID=UPI0033C38B44